MTEADLRARQIINGVIRKLFSVHRLINAVGGKKLLVIYDSNTKTLPEAENQLYICSTFHICSVVFDL